MGSSPPRGSVAPDGIGGRDDVGPHLDAAQVGRLRAGDDGQQPSHFQGLDEQPPSARSPSSRVVRRAHITVKPSPKSRLPLQISYVCRHSKTLPNWRHRRQQLRWNTVRPCRAVAVLQTDCSLPSTRRMSSRNLGKTGQGFPEAHSHPSARGRRVPRTAASIKSTAEGIAGREASAVEPIRPATSHESLLVF